MFWSWAVARAAREAQRALATRRYAEAQERARRWLRLRPGAADANYVIARAALALEQAVVTRLRSEHDRLNELEQGLLRSPGDDDLEAEMGRWMLDHGHDEEGRRWAEEIIQRHPAHPLANPLLQTYLARRGELGLANFYRSQAEARSK